MEYCRFVEEVKAEAERLCSGGYGVRVQEVVKNNGGVRTGLTFTKKGGAGRSISPTIYPELYYEMYMVGAMTVECAAKKMLDTAAGCGGQGAMALPLADDLNDFEKVKGKIIFQLVGYGANRELLKKVPYVPYCNLAIVFYIFLGKNRGGCMMARVHNEHMEAWGTDAGTLYRLAGENTPRMLPPAIKPMGEVIREIAKSHMGGGFDEGVLEGVEAAPLYVLTNEAGVNGAAVVLYDGVLRGLAGETGGDLIILPSSIHETLAIPYGDHPDAAGLGKVVAHINRTEVLPEEVLSDSVYHYSRATDRVTVMSGGGK